MLETTCWGNVWLFFLHNRKKSRINLNKEWMPYNVMVRFGVIYQNTQMMQQQLVYFAKTFKMMTDDIQ